MHLRLPEIDADFVKDLEEKYGHQAEVELRIVPGGSHVERFSEARFWAVISLLNWSKTGDDEAVLNPSIAHLAEQPIAHIYQFQDWLAQKLFELDTRNHAEAMGSEHFSADSFLYARCCVVANGQTAFEAIKNDPSKMPNLDFEALLFLAETAFELKTGRPFNYQPTHSIETASNENGWKNG